MSDPVSLSVSASFAMPLFEKLWQAGSGAFESLKSQYGKAELKRKIEEASYRYEQRYLKRHGQIKIMPGLMKEPVSLETIYTAVKLLDERDKRYFYTEQGLEEVYRQIGRRSFQIGAKARLDGMHVATQHQFLMVLGGPGIGKSTFLKRLGFEALKKDGGRFSKKRLPVFLELKGLREDELDLVAVLAKEFDTCGFPVLETFITGWLAEGQLLVLLDGLDEVPKHKLNKVIQCIEDFVDKHDNNHFVASCRAAAYHTSFRRFTDVTMAEFDDEQIREFINRWFNSELDKRERTAKKYWQLLSNTEFRGIKELAQTPLLLTFLCLVYDREQFLPFNRSDLYDKALNILLTEWAAQKRLEPKPIYKGFTPSLEKELLGQIAYDTFKDERLFFSKDEIIKRVTDFLSQVLNVPKRLDGNAVLMAIEVQQGILVERVTNTYSFSHLTIQEYLVAQHITWNDLIEDIVEHHVCAQRWREVFLLIAGLLRGKGPKKLWLRLEQAARERGTATPKVKQLVKWANTVINTQYKKVDTSSARQKFCPILDEEKLTADLRR